MRQSLFVTFAICAIAVIVGGVSVTSNVLLGGARWDVTQDKLYTLSSSTDQVIGGLEDRVTVDFYAAEDALAQDPSLRTYAQRVRDMLGTYSARSNGKITIIDHNPAPFSPTEDAAIAAGLTPVAGPNLDDPILYLGLVVRAGPDRIVRIPLLQPEREARLEYDITRALMGATQKARPRLAVLTSLPWLFATDPQSGDIKPVAQIATELARTFDIKILSDDFKELPAQTDVLLIAQPGDLSPSQLYALDQFALRKGRILVLLDPASTVAKDGGGGEVTGSQALGPLAQAWGLSVGGNVVLDRQEALPVQTQINGRDMVAPQPLFFSIPKSGLNSTSLMTAGLERGLHVGTPGEILPRPNSGLKFEPLLTTSSNTMVMEARRALSGLSPDVVAAEWEEAGSSFVIGASITGKLRTAFPSGPPEGQAQSGPARPSLSVSAKDAQLMVLGDVDVLADSLYLTQDGEVADNGAFVLNAAEILAGAQTLTSLRARAPSARPLVLVERLKTRAQARVLDEQEQLQTTLDNAAARLRELEAMDAAKGLLYNDARTGLTQSEQSELTRVRREVLETRKRLRQVQEGVRRTMASIKTLLILASGFLVPTLMLAFGAYALAAAHTRARRARQASRGDFTEPKTEVRL